MSDAPLNLNCLLSGLKSRYLSHPMIITNKNIDKEFRKAKEKLAKLNIPVNKMYIGTPYGLVIVNDSKIIAGNRKASDWLIKEIEKNDPKRNKKKKMV